MIFISLTRLRVRSLRFVPLFFYYAVQTRQQVSKAAGFQQGALLADRSWTFWTMTAWDSQESMRAYMTAGSHARAMPRLMHWCDEASVAHWNQEDAALPPWTEADQRMRATGRPSKVRYPTPQHATLQYAAPRISGSSVIRPA